MNELHINNKFRWPNMRLKLNKEFILFLITRLLFLLFVYSALDKIYDFEKFKAQMEQSPILTAYAAYIVWAIPTIELITAVLGLFQKTTLVGLYASFALMIMFTVYIFIIMNYSEYIPCSCNGILEGASWGEHLIFNICFTLLALTGILLQIRIDKIQLIKTY